MEKRFNTRRQLKHWLKTATLAAVSSICLIEPAGKLEITNNAALMEQLFSDNRLSLPKGPYLVEYEYPEPDEVQDLDYSKMVMVMGLDVTLRSTGHVVGSLRQLIASLGEFEYCMTSLRNHPGYRIAGLWVVEPKNLDELHKLKRVLAQHALGYAFNDGTGFISQNNFTFNKEALALIPEGAKPPLPV
mgnify:CR=1 FL=1